MKNTVKKTDKLVFDLEMSQIDYNIQKKESLRHEIANKYGVPVTNVEVNFIPITVNKKGEKFSVASNIITNIQDPKFHIELFKRFMEYKEIDDIDIDEIQKIDEQVNALIDFDQYSKFKTYKFKHVRWKNYLSYGDDNFFDFTKLDGLVLLNGSPENQCGKTTFAIDLLRFALFGKAEKSPTLDSVFNIYKPEETEAFVEACLEIDGSDYVIRRTVTRPALNRRTEKSKCKQKVEYFKSVNGEYELIENCEGESNTQTNNIIKEVVGSVEDYNMVISATSYSLASLIHLGQSDRSKLFSKWLGLLSVEKKEEVAKKIWKENYYPSLMTNKYNVETLRVEIENLGNTIMTNTNTIKDKEKQKKDCEEKINEYDLKKSGLLSDKKSVNTEIANTDIHTIDVFIGSQNEMLDKKRGEFGVLKNRYNEIKDVEEFKSEELDEVKKEITDKKNEIHRIEVNNAELRVLYNKNKDDIGKINDLVAKKICPTCGENINVATKGNEIQQINAKNKELIDKGKDNNEMIEVVKKTISMLEDKENKLNDLKKINDEKVNLELKLTGLKVNIDNIKMTIENKTALKNEVLSNMGNIEHNNKIDAELRVVNETLRVENSVKDKLIMDIQRLNSENEYKQRDINTKMEIVKKLEAETAVIKTWNAYFDMVGKNGIIKIVLREALPIINNEVDRILNGLCDFKVVMGVNEKNEIMMELVRDGKSLDLGTCASGFESVMASLALRSALAGIGTMSKSNFLTLDEILDGVAVSNYDNVRELYKRIENNYDFILHITHNELLTDWHKQNINVFKENNVSKIQLLSIC